MPEGSAVAYSDSPDLGDLTKRQLAKQVPKPVGYRILVALPEMEEATEGGIVIPQSRVDDEQKASIATYVMELGPECYKHKKFFGAKWCKPGDWVIASAYAGQPIMLGSVEFRFINDDSVMGTVENPMHVHRAER